MGAETTFASAFLALPRGTGRGFRFFTTKNEEHFYPYEQMQDEARRRAAFLTGLGLKKGDRVAIVVPEGDEFVLTFLGAVVAGIVPVPIYPRATFKNLDGYVDTLAHIAGAAKARVLVTMEATKPYVEKVLERGVGVEKLVLIEELFRGDPPPFTAPELGPDGEVLPDKSVLAPDAQAMGTPTRTAFQPAYAGSAAARPSTSGDGRAAPGDAVCPATHPIEASHSPSGEPVYHPDQRAAPPSSTPETCFATEADARAAGYRASQR